MTKTLIVPLDGSPDAERAVGPAATLARALGADIRLVSAEWDGGAPRAGRYLNAVAALCGVSVIDTRVVADVEPVRAIDAVVAESPEPAVVMATHGRGAVGAAVLGSVASGVVREVDAPVVLVGPNVLNVDAFETLVVPLDGSARSEAVLPTAEQWARTLDVPMRFLAVPEPSGIEGLYTVDDGFVLTEQRLERACVSMRDHGIDASYAITPSLLPARAIVRFVRNMPHSLLCMSTHGRAGIARVAVGSVTMGVVRSAPCPVVCTRPRDLVG